MLKNVDFAAIDVGLAVIANLANLLLVGIFLSRPAGRSRIEFVLGLIFVALALPLTGAVLLNALAGRPWWTIALPIPLIQFCGAELILDYLLRLDFRHSELLRPYLLLYYVSLVAMVGYAFGVGKVAGLITLGTYALNLAATWYSYSRVGHGSGRQRPASGGMRADDQMGA
jgi:hypothetical protein